MRSIEHPVSKIWSKLSSNIAAKNVQRTCPAWDRICPISTDISDDQPRYFCLNFDSGATRHQIVWNLDIRVTSIQGTSSRRCFSQIQRFLFWFSMNSKNLGFEINGRNISNGLELWIHTKIGGRWWGSSYHQNPWKESMKNSSNYKIENQAKNNFKITKMKNIIAQNRRWFNPKAWLY
jgi:hypothetical protein